jgi:hypothetical protein
MFRQGRIPVFVHGVIDYLLGAFLVAAPFVLGFDDDTATAAAVGAGVVILVVAATSDLPTALVTSIPRALHALLDYLVAIAIIAAPFALAFTDDGTATPVFVVVGVFHLLQAIATRYLRQKDGRRGDDSPRSSA